MCGGGDRGSSSCSVPSACLALATVWQEDSSFLSQPRLPEPSLSLVPSVLIVLETDRGVFGALPHQPPARQPSWARGRLGAAVTPHKCRICSLGTHCKEAQRWESLLGTHVPTRQGLWQADPCPPPALQTSGHRLERHSCVLLS